MKYGYLPVESLKLDADRQRQDFDAAAMFELVEDIRSTGLIQPIVVAPDGTLLAGERRFRAISELYEQGIHITCLGLPVPFGDIPAIHLSGESSELLRAQIEYSENEFRSPLTWQERARAVAKLAELRTLQAAAANKPAPTHLELAIETLGKREVVNPHQTAATIRHQIGVAALLADPEVAAAPTLKEALKVAKRKEQTANNLLAAQEFTRKATTSDLTKVHTLINDSCIEFLKQYSGRPIDCIISDPPYGIGAHNFGDGASSIKGHHVYDDSFESWKRLMPEFLYLAWGATAEPGCMYLFCDIDRFHHLSDMAREAGWYVHRTPLIWAKGRNGLVPIVGQSHSRSYEVILYACKGPFKLQATAQDVITVPADENLGHGAQKPVELYAELLRRSAPAGSLVADFFAGSGPMLPAAHAHSCASIVCELDTSHFGIITKRFAALTP